jgi:hypothetical protein
MRTRSRAHRPVVAIKHFPRFALDADTPALGGSHYNEFSLKGRRIITLQAFSRSRNLLPAPGLLAESVAAQEMPNSQPPVGSAKPDVGAFSK